VPAVDLRTAARPEVGARIVLQVLSTGAEVFAVVDAVALPDRLLLGEPFDAEGRHVEPLASGSDLRLVWTTTAGRHEVEATMAGVVRERVPLWRVEVRSAPKVLQRRDYTRAPDSLRGEIHYGNLWSKLVVLDLSEGGARCMVRDPGELPVGGAVQLRTSLEDQEVLLEATLLEAEPQDGLGELVQVRLRFAELGRTADLVRRRVLEQQRKARASGRG
jgi:c-di-GMP-binding flagellar brake protein YcgR